MSFIDIFLPILTIFVYILIGYILRITNKVDFDATKTFSTVAVNVFLPAIIIRTYVNNLSIDNIAENLELIFWGAIVISSLYALSFVLSKLFTKDDYEKKVYRYTFTTSNYGAIGYALVASLFGEVGLFRFMMLTMPVSLFAYTEGFRILSNSKKINIKFLLSPAIIAIVIGIILGLTGVKLPSFFTNIMDALANMFSPISMIVTGIAIASYPFKHVFLNKKTYLVAIIKMVVLPLVIMGIMLLIGVSKEVVIFVTTFCMLPLGMNTIIFPRSLGKDCMIGVQTVSVGTALSLITMPLFVWLFTLI